MSTITPYQQKGLEVWTSTLLLLTILSFYSAQAFLPPWECTRTIRSNSNSSSQKRGVKVETALAAATSLGDFIEDPMPKMPDNPQQQRTCQARDLIQSLVQEQQCFTDPKGAEAFLENCANDVVWEDCFQSSQPLVGKEQVAGTVLSRVEQRRDKGTVRIDRISDGTAACGYAWTWVSADKTQEGLRGTTFVELDGAGKIQYIREIPEPLYKPGDLTVELLKAVTKNALPKPKPQYQQQTPTAANEIAKYLFLDVQGSEIDESMRFFDEQIVYRDFNYEDPLQGPEEVRRFIEDFSFPGIEFRPERFDDGVNATCFTWKVLLEGVDEANAVKGISFYEVNPETEKVVYVRDVPESSIKPPPLGSLARILNPGLGVFQGVPNGSRPGGK